MLSVHAVSNTQLEVKILPPHFHDDLSRLKVAIKDKHRSYNDDKQVWIIYNADLYKHLDWVLRALENIRLPEPGEIKLTQGVLWPREA